MSNNKELQELIEWMDRATIALYAELPESVANDVRTKWQNLKTEIASSLCDLGAGASTGEGAEVATLGSSSGNSVEHGWNHALTVANNICVQISDSYNDDDEIQQADAARECAKKIRSLIGDYSLLNNQKH